jgi:hypothetical protein
MVPAWAGFIRHEPENTSTSLMVGSIPLKRDCFKNDPTYNDLHKERF